MRYLALDYGDRRTGIALSDPDGKIAFSQGFLDSSTQSQLLDDLSELCNEHEVIKIIIGLPIHTDGQEGQRAKLTREFADELRKKLPQLEIEFFDERFTTQWAVNKLHQAGMKMKDQKGERDGMAAQILLQTYLDGLE